MVAKQGRRTDPRAYFPLDESVGGAPERSFTRCDVFSSEKLSGNLLDSLVNDVCEEQRAAGTRNERFWMRVAPQLPWFWGSVVHFHTFLILGTLSEFNDASKVCSKSYLRERAVTSQKFQFSSVE